MFQILLMYLKIQKILLNQMILNYQLILMSH
jgi:hypothetical protein